MPLDSDDSDSDCLARDDASSISGQHEEADEDCPWRSAVDPRSGRTYYYHVKTRETQWRKPMEMASREERDAIAAKETRQKEFFAAMEANILKSISAGMKAPEKKSLLDEEYENKEISEEPLTPNIQNPNEINWVPPPSVLDRRSTKGGGPSRPDLVRTISTMDTSVLRELIKRVPSTRNVGRASRNLMGASNHSAASNRSSISGRSMGGSSHHSYRQRIMHGVPGPAALGTPVIERPVGSAVPAYNNVKRSNSEDFEDELPPLTVVTTPDLKTQMKRMASLKLENLKPERTDSLKLDQLNFDDDDEDDNNVMESYDGSNGMNLALSNHSFHLDQNDSEPPDLVNHNSRSQSSFAGAGSFSSFDSSHNNSGAFDGENNNSMGAHMSISSSLHPVEEGMDESDRSLSFRVGGASPKEIVLDGTERDRPRKDNSFNLEIHNDSKEDAANWLEGLPDDNEDRSEDMVGYGNAAKPFKDAGFASFFDESMANFDLSEKETKALQKLALISEQMTQVMESEEDEEEESDDDDEDDDDDDDDEVDFNESGNRSFQLNFEESDGDTGSNQESEESSLEKKGTGKSSPSFQTRITASSGDASFASPNSSAQKRAGSSPGTKNIRVPRAVRNKLTSEGTVDSAESSSQEESPRGNFSVPGLAGAMLTTDNPRSHLPATLTTDNPRSHLSVPLTTDNARSHFAKPGEGGSSSSLNNVSGHSHDTSSSSIRRSAVRLPKRGQLRQKSGLSLGSPDLGPPLGASPMSASAKSQNVPKRGMSKRPDLVRRNTCGTLYVGTTMSAPDKDATIKCICGVYRAHILQSELAEEEPDWTHYRIFNDLESQQGSVPKNAHRSRKNANRTIPSLEEITTFYRDVFQRAQMEYDCIIISLIYVERLIKTTYGALRPRACNWRSILFSCMVLASKVWDDLSMWNADFSQTCPSGVKFPLKRINELEVAILSALSYKVKVPASEYAKYYFLLRTMLIKSGLVGENVDTASPLDVEGAKRLQQVSTQFQSGIGANKRQMRKAKSMRNTLRSKSMGEADRTKVSEGVRKAQELKSKVSLEHVVHM